MVGATGVGVRGGRDPATVGECLVAAVDEENVLRFEVCMDEIEVMQD